jgi:hypothetical protein
MRRLWIVVALLAFGYTLLPAMPASAGYGAIAWDRDTGKYGASWNQPTPQRAEEAALGECGMIARPPVLPQSKTVTRTGQASALSAPPTATSSDLNRCAGRR